MTFKVSTTTRSTGGLIVITLLCFICYWNSLSGDLLHDDIFAIKDNSDVRPNTPLHQLFGNDFWGKPIDDPTSHKSYRPLTVLSFRLNYALHELRPWGYHMVNALLHTSCTLLVYVTVENIVFSGFTNHHSLSLQTALLFAAHPIHTEAVSVVHILDMWHNLINYNLNLIIVVKWCIMCTNYTINSLLRC